MTKPSEKPGDADGPIHVLLYTLALQVGSAQAWRMFLDAVRAIVEAILPPEFQEEAMMIVDMFRMVADFPGKAED